MRVNFVRKATGSKKRPWPEGGRACIKCRKPIMKGDPYQWVASFRGPKRIICGSCQFTRGELTDSLKSSVYDAFDAAYAELDGADADTDFSSILDPLVDAVREVEDQYRQAAEPFGDSGPNADLADECDSCASELESIDVPEIQSFEDWTAEQNSDETEEFEDVVADHEGDDDDRPQRAPHDDDELRDRYADYVQEQIDEFRSAIENADTL